MLTISRLKRHSIKYYNDTADETKQAAMDRQRANGGLAEYYSEGETRIPTWLIVGDKQHIGQATGLTDAQLEGGDADTEHARIWLDDGQSPNGNTGREFTDKSVHGFDLTFAAPKSVSLLRALTDDIAEKVLATAHTKAVHAAMAYLHDHAGYTRVYNRVTGNRDLQRLPGLVAIAYQHETSRCGDPHLHTHVIVPNRQPRADGQLVSLDSKSLHHEAKAAGIIYQATLRHELHAEREDNTLHVDSATVVVVDEASMLGTPELKKLLSCVTVGRAKMVLVGDAYQLSLVKARGGMFEQLCTELPWSERLGEVWRMTDPAERDTSLALRAAHGNRLRKAVKWYQNNGRLHAGDAIAMAADALHAYLSDRADQKDALLICDTWEMADALNHRLHEQLTTPGPTLTAARDQHIGLGDIIMSRANDTTIDVRPSPEHRSNRADQVRNGNRWRVAAIDPDTNRLAAERLTDHARAVFQTDYLKEHVTLGYAATVHSAQGVTADSSYAILGEGASRAMAYVAMTRGRNNNEAFLYQKFSQEADHEHAKPVAAPAIHQTRRGDKHSAAYYFRQILGNDDRPRTMHAEAERTDPALLPEVVTEVIQRHQERRRTRHTAWQAHMKTAEAWRAGHERMAAAAETRTAGIDLDADGLEQ